MNPYSRTTNILQQLQNRQAGFNTNIQFAHECHSNLSLVRRFQRSKQLDFHDGCVNALGFNVSGSILLSGSDDEKVVIWDWMNKRVVGWFDSEHKSNVFQTRFIPFSSDRMIATSGLDGTVRMAELDSTGMLRRSKSIAKHNGPCHKIIITVENPNCVISCGEDGCVNMMDIRIHHSWKALTVLNHRSRMVPLYSISSRPLNTNEFVTCGMDHWLRVFDYRFTRQSNGTLVKKFCPPLLNQRRSVNFHSSIVYPHVTSVMYSPNGKEIIGSYHNHHIYLFNADDTDQSSFVHEYYGHRNFDTVKGVNFYGYNGEYIISGSDCGHLFIWDKETQRIVWYDRADDSGTVNVIEPHPTNPIIATSGYDSSIKVWEPIRPEPVSLSNLKNIIKNNTPLPYLGNQLDMLLRMVPQMPSDISIYPSLIPHYPSDTQSDGSGTTFTSSTTESGNDILNESFDEAIYNDEDFGFNIYEDDSIDITFNQSGREYATSQTSNNNDDNSVPSDFDISLSPSSAESTSDSITDDELL
ncbi:hypothetical protein GJ496_006439 [Pomphorhynchus laevis]|nr:hypothetical protein GJ496_006439 [Pomphorhynchus laevis]